MNALLLYDAARTALAQALTIDEVRDWEDKAAAVREYARRAKNRDLEIDAAEIRVRAQRRRGELLAEMRAQGRLVEGRKKLSSADDSLRVTLAELDTSLNESSRDQKLAAIEPDAFERLTARCRTRMAEEEKLHSFDVLRERDGPVNGARAVMGSRQEPDDSLDYFPTPPWATRALICQVLPHLGIDWRRDGQVIACDPACGEGHITGVLEEYVPRAMGSDVFDYSVDGVHPPGWLDRFDFLADPWPDRFGPVDWIVTNPPFEEKALAFALRALALARRGVALFVQLRWLETLERYEQLFRPTPPTLCAWFVERVNLCKGRWDPDGSTATAYMWLVWAHTPEASEAGYRWCPPQGPVWIPPICRDGLTLATDRERFTAHPVGPWHDPETGEIIESTNTPGRSGTAREAPSTGSGTTALAPSVGAEPAARSSFLDDKSQAKAAPDASTPLSAVATADDGSANRSVDAAAVSRLPAGRTAGSGGGALAGVPAIDPPVNPAIKPAEEDGGLEIPPSLRRVALSEGEVFNLAALAALADWPAALELNARLFVRRLADNPAGATERDRRYLASIVAKHLGAAAPGEATA